MATLEPAAMLEQQQPAVDDGLTGTEARKGLLQSLQVPTDDLGGSTMLATSLPDSESATFSPASVAEATAVMQEAQSKEAPASDWRKVEDDSSLETSDLMGGDEGTRQREEREEEEEEEVLETLKDEEEVLETLRDEEEEVEQLDPMESDATRIEAELGHHMLQLTSAVLDSLDALLHALEGIDAKGGVSDARRAVISSKLLLTQEHGTLVQMIREALDNLPTTPDPSNLNEDVLLAENLCRLLESLEKAMESVFATKPTNLSALKKQRRFSGMTSVSNSSDELRDPFYEASEVDHISKMLKYMSALERHGTSAAGVSPSPASVSWPTGSTQSPKLPAKLAELHDTDFNHVQKAIAQQIAPVADLFPKIRSLASARRQRLRSPVESVASIKGLSRRGSIASSLLSNNANVRESESVDGHSRMSRASLLSGTGTAKNSWADHIGKGFGSQTSLIKSARPPRYSDEIHGFARYSMGDEKSSRDSLAQLQSASSFDQQDAVHRAGGPAGLDLQAAYGARTVEDLQLLEASLDRVYQAIPQLGEQRSTMRPGQSREAALGDLFAKFASTSRMEDQRARAPFAQPSNLANGQTTAAESSIASRAAARLFSAASIRRRFSVGSLVSSFGSSNQQSSVFDDRHKGKEKARSSSPQIANSDLDSQRHTMDDSDDRLLDLLAATASRSRMQNQDAPLRARAQTVSVTSLASPHFTHGSGRNGEVPEGNSHIPCDGVRLSIERESLRGEKDSELSDVVRVFIEWQDSLNCILIILSDPHGRSHVNTRYVVTGANTIELDLKDSSCVLRLPKEINLNCPQGGSFALRDSVAIAQIGGSASSETVEHAAPPLLTTIRRIDCANCQSLLVIMPTARKCLPLPSEGWEEMVDAWMCHEDQELNQAVTLGKQALDARGTNMFYDGFWIQLPDMPDALHVQVNAEDELQCRQCSATVGTLGSQAPHKVQLARHAVLSSGPPSEAERTSFSRSIRWLITRTCESADAHRATITCRGSKNEQIVVWVFKYSAVIDSGTLRKSYAGEIGASYHSKILFKNVLPAAATEDDKPQLELPAAFFNALAARLETHHHQIPASQRTLLSWKVSWM